LFFLFLLLSILDGYDEQKRKLTQAKMQGLFIPGARFQPTLSAARRFFHRLTGAICSLYFHG
jgi:hypothetical protein